MFIRLSIVFFAALFLASCSGTGRDESAKKPAPDKPAAKTEPASVLAPPEKQIFNQEQVAKGEKLFNEKCIKCHKQYAEGEPYWQRKDKDGKFPPPPLDGTAHAWHHPMEVLHKYIKKGGKEYGGIMEGYEGGRSYRQPDNGYCCLDYIALAERCLRQVVPQGPDDAQLEGGRLSA